MLKEGIDAIRYNIL